MLYSSRSQIKGLTTTAGLWASGIVGPAISAGLYTITSADLKKYKTHEEIIDALKTLDYIYHIEEMHS